MLQEVSVMAKVWFNSCTVVLSAILVYLGLDSEVFSLFALLLLLDYISGIAKAKVLGVAITSNRMKYGLISKISLIIMPITLAIGAKAAGADFTHVLAVSMNILIVSEVYSVIGNVYAIRTREELPEYDVVASLGKKIRTVLIRAEGDK